MKAVLGILLVFFPWLAGAQVGMNLRAAEIIEQQNTNQVTPMFHSAGIAEQEVGVVLAITPDFDVAEVEKTGASVNTQLDGVVTLRATPIQLSKITKVKGVTFITANNRALPKLNVATPIVKVDSVWQGFGGLPQGYTGKDVVVGVADFGFNYTHPTFYDTLGNLRVVRVWNQGDTKGSKPSGFTYGSEYKDPATIVQKAYSALDESHGTHVTGIAAGSGGKVKTYKGVAHEADIVMVQLNKGYDNEVVDAINYIFNYAASVGKPAVVNLSLGYHWGPHDGTSTMDLAMDRLSGPGRIIVGAAGNEGDVKLHASHCFMSSTDTVRTIMGVTADNTTNVYAWADIGRNMNWNIEIWDNTTKRLRERLNTRLYTTNSRTEQTFDKTFTYGADVIKVEGRGAFYNYNGVNSQARGIIQVGVTNNSSRYSAVLVLKADYGQVHLWNSGDEDDPAEFESLNLNSTWMDGDTECTIGEIGGTGKSIISVGAYVSKTTWNKLQGGIGKNFDERVGAMATFSSLGPTADGRVKPDLVAPGSMIASSVNKHDFNYTGFSSSVVAKEPSDNFYYAVMQGTSMASPVVTGGVALLLQARPWLTPDSIRCILQQSSTLDSTLQELPKTTRGAGMLNMLSAIQEQSSNTYSTESAISTCITTGITSDRFWGGDKNQLNFSIVPNPNSGVFHVKTDEEGVLTLNVYSFSGALLHSKEVQTGSEVSLQFLPQGVYLVQLNKGEKWGTQKMLIRR